MRLSLYVALGYFLVVGLAGWFVLNVFVVEVKPGVREAMEDTLVDTANLVAELVAPQLAARLASAPSDTDADPGAPDPIAAALGDYRQRTVSARIWNIDKLTLDHRLYIADMTGRVLYASEPAWIGRDFSRWNDVYLTIRGAYGARATRDNADDPSTSVMYVAAPVIWQGETIGVVSVGKPSATVAPFIERSEAKIRSRGLLLLLVSGLIGALFTWHLTQAIGRMRGYARDVAAGRRSSPPRFKVRELADLSAAVTAMRERLEGRRYVERYVMTLTHELKGPLAAIRGAAELLAEPDMPPGERRRFVDNILAQEERMRTVAERLLHLVRVEQLEGLDERVPIDLRRLTAEAVEATMATARARGIRIQVHGPDRLPISGEPFLLRQAICNLLDNAIAFSPHGGEIRVEIAEIEGEARVSVRDQGPGIPDYARSRAFERFFSLPRPDGTAKSTGLGLSLVAEVAGLHGGTASLENYPGGGAVARLSLP